MTQKKETSEILETVKRFIEREGLFEPRGKILAAVSGGADSLCLLFVLHALGYSLHAAHFDHRLRPDSGRDAEVVRSAADRLGVPCTVGWGDVKEHAGRNRLTIEEAARALRYDFLVRSANAAGACVVATGHTMNDQAETVLMHLVRGTGLRGLGGMRPAAVPPVTGMDPDPVAAQIRLVRPLLCLTHADTVGFCSAASLTPSEDPANQDPAYTRNKIRKELLPILEKHNPLLVESLARLSEIARGQNDFVEDAADKIWKVSAEEVEPGLIRIPSADLQAVPPAVRQALVRRAVLESARSVEDLAYRHVVQVVEFVRRPTASRRMDVALGVTVSLENDRLVFNSPKRRPAQPEWEGRELSIPGELAIRYPHWRIRAMVSSESPAGDDTQTRDPWVVRIAPDRLHPPVVIRRRRSGDAFFPAGMPGPVKLNDFLASHHLPFSERDYWPLVCDADGIIWIPGYRVKEGLNAPVGVKGFIELKIEKSKITH